MKNLYLYLSLFLYSLTVLSQNENNHWQFGELDLNFSTNPVVVTTQSGLSSTYNYGIASISDQSGNLLFYTYGKNIYNRNHEVMTNGYIYTESFRSHQNAVIVPHPGDPNRYFVIWNAYYVLACTGCPESGSFYYYAEIDFTNNSLGELLPINEGGSFNETLFGENKYYKPLKDASGVVIKNSGDFRPLTVTKNITNNGYWVIAQSSNDLLSFKVDASGFNTQPVSTAFSSTIYNGNLPVFRVVPNYTNINNLKFYSLQPGIRVYRADFNSNTGQFSNYEEIMGNSGDHFEFSPDFKKIYYNAGNKINVKDLTSLTTAGRVLNEFVNPTVESSNFFAIQKDKYNNLIVSSNSSTSNKNKYIHKIENPDSFLNSSVRVNYVSLNNKNYVNYLPQLIERVPISCIENIVLSTTETAVNRTYKVSNSITTNNNYIVNTGSTITLQAQNAIYLQPNTDIKSGSVFVAEIKSCSVILQKSTSYIEDSVNSYENESTSNQSLILYPNPANQSVTISANYSINNLTITSMEGFTMYRKDVMSNSVDIDISDYKKGIYVVTIQTSEGKMLTEKLIKN